MDYQEALEKHEKDCRRCRERICKYAIKKFSCLQEIDIKAYEELMSYRRIGTLEEFKELKERELSGVELAKIACNLNHLEKYKQLGTLDEVRAAVEKQKPIAPTYDGDGYAPDGTFVFDEWLCPNCGTRYEVEFEQHDYCPGCGQAIDWSE